MKKYRIGTAVFEAATLLEAIQHVKQHRLAGKLVEVKGNQPQATAINDGDKKVVVTCGYGQHAHKWETTKGQAIVARNKCPQHRS